MKEMAVIEILVVSMIIGALIALAMAGKDALTIDDLDNLQFMSAESDW